MSNILIFLFLGFIGLILSQLGGRLAAKLSLSWWFTLGFILLALVSPSSLHPISSYLGIELVSNLVLGALTFILMVHGLELSAASTVSTRKISEMVSNLALDSYSGTQVVKQLSLNHDSKPRCLVVCPCYNEADNLEQFSKSVHELKKDWPMQIDFLIVNDGSIDGSKVFLEQQKLVYSVHHPVNIGVAGVLKTGFKLASKCEYDFVIQCDTDGQHPVSNIPKILEHSMSHGVDLLIGSRFLDPGAITSESTTFLRRMGSIIILQFLRLFGRRASVTDPTSGLRVYSKSAYRLLLKVMPDEYPEPEIIAIIASHRGKISELQVGMMPRTAGASSIAGFHSFHYVVKVISALIGLRIRSFLMPR